MAQGEVERRARPERVADDVDLAPFVRRERQLLDNGGDEILVGLNVVGGVGVAVPEEVIAERPTSTLFHEIEPPRFDPRHLRRRGEAVQEHDRNRRFAGPDAHDGP